MSKNVHTAAVHQAITYMEVFAILPALYLIGLVTAFVLLPRDTA